MYTTWKDDALKPHLSKEKEADKFMDVEKVIIYALLFAYFIIKFLLFVFKS